MSSQTPSASVEEPDYDRLLRSNLERVFNERAPGPRAQAIADLFVDHPVLHEPDAIVEGRAAISDVVGKLLDRFGPDFAFVPAMPAVGHHGMGALRWHGGPPHDRAMVSGMDVAAIVDGRIERLWVFLDRR